MSLKKIFLLPTSQTQSKYGKEENGKRLFTTWQEKEESGKTDVYWSLQGNPSTLRRLPKHNYHAWTPAGISRDLNCAFFAEWHNRREAAHSS